MGLDAAIDAVASNLFIHGRELSRCGAGFAK